MYSFREIETADLPAVAALLTEGFPRRSPDFWDDRLQRLRTRTAAPGTPQFGYGIETADGLQGVALALGSVHAADDGAMTIVNISSWTVRPALRGKPAKELYGHASRLPGLTYSNLSAALHTQKAIKAFGFAERTAGQFIGIGTRRSRARVAVLPRRDAERHGLNDAMAEMLAHHEQRGCIALCLDLPDRLAPLLFLPRRVKPGLPIAQLIYCQRESDLIDHGATISAALLKRGFLALLVDASAPVPGMLGRYVPGRAAKYYKGPFPGLFVDHSYSEMIYIGF
ncbi:MAG: hypothetical protein WCO11_10525 [Sphingomonadales bacterium]